jgi:hypothetical protein
MEITDITVTKDFINITDNKIIKDIMNIANIIGVRNQAYGPKNKCMFCTSITCFFLTWKEKRGEIMNSTGNL